MIQFDSSNVAAADYEPDQQELRVQYRDHATGEPGKTYRYFEVPAAHWDGIQAADSVGKYISAHIVKGGFRYEVVG